jgi:predicted nucleotide-binding protein
MYYHVLAEIFVDGKSRSSTQKVAEFDKADLLEIKEDVVAPYLRKESFIIDGYQITDDKLKRLIVKSSENPIRAITEKINDEIPANVIVYIGETDALDYKEHFKDVTKDVMRELARSEAPAETSSPSGTPALDSVFIVHGHDDLAKTEAARFVEKLGLTAVILHEQASEGKTIIEKIEAYSDVGFGIVLYTPDDVGKKLTEKVKLQPRARQNVVFEHGYLIGRLGRRNVVALMKDHLEKPNDISGIVYVEMDPKAAWRYQIANEMKAAGYAIDLNRL